MRCPASVEREAAVRAREGDKSSPAADWGTRCHALLALGLTLECSPSTLLGPDEDQELGQVADYAFARIRDLAGDQVVPLSEARVDAGVAIDRDDMWGHADVVMWHRDSLRVIDLKTGLGVMVEADDPQLRIYLLGAVHKFGGPQMGYETEVSTEIIQPRGHHPAGPIRTWTTTVGDLYRWAKDVLAPAAAATDQPGAPARPSEDACRWCRARATCRELAEHSMSATLAVFRDAPVTLDETRGHLADSLIRNPAQLTPDEIQYVLDHEKLIAGWLRSVREYATDTVKGGGHIPGYKLARGRKSRSWSVDDTEVGDLIAGIKAKDGKKLGKGVAYITSVISPAQAEKKVKPLVGPTVWERIEGLIATSEGAPTLVPDTDVRQEILTDATKIFQPIR